MWDAVAVAQRSELSAQLGVQRSVRPLVTVRSLDCHVPATKSHFLSPRDAQPRFWQSHTRAPPCLSAGSESVLRTRSYRMDIGYRLYIQIQPSGNGSACFELHQRIMHQRPHSSIIVLRFTAHRTGGLARKFRVLAAEFNTVSAQYSALIGQNSKQPPVNLWNICCVRARLDCLEYCRSALKLKLQD